MQMTALSLIGVQNLELMRKIRPKASKYKVIRPVHTSLPHDNPTRNSLQPCFSLLITAQAAGQQPTLALAAPPPGWQAPPAGSHGEHWQRKSSPKYFDNMSFYSVEMRQR